MEKFKEEIHDYLNDTLELDLKILEKNVNDIVLKHFNIGEIHDYWVVCDNTNNTPYIIANNLINIDVYFKKDEVSDTLCYNITMKVDKIKNLQRKRQKKLDKISEAFIYGV